MWIFFNSRRQESISVFSEVQRSVVVVEMRPSLCFSCSSFGRGLGKDTTQACKNRSCLTWAPEREGQEVRTPCISQEPSSFSSFMNHKTHSLLLPSASFFEPAACGLQGHQPQLALTPGLHTLIGIESSQCPGFERDNLVVSVQAVN